MRIARDVQWPELRSHKAFGTAGAGLAHLFDFIGRMRKVLAARDQKIALAINAADIEVVAAVPSDPPELQGAVIRIYDDGSTTRRIYVWVNDAWRYVALT